jgi:uncharacterized protein (TIGR02996 family)
MSEADALLAAVCEAPEDDVPRLVYAGWLEEHGDQNRADFICGQIALAALGEDEGVQALARSPHLGRLRALRLESNRFGDAGLLALADSSLGESLRELRVYGNSFTQATRRKVKERMGARVTF